ncbi:aminotransferase class I/II-fold pyridoxal phosphate-dependent enzyme [Candidatus Parcubacteria bacterium]|nr:aminotransferase class I/II-fold pyridoxal phosphate-dependent enzyme [Candidatus Parcubacteria bacterium]
MICLMENEKSEYKDLTQHELEALKNEFNLADAHTHQSQSVSQRKIVESLPEIWYESERLMQHESDERFIKAFFTFHKQPKALETPSMLVYASSIAMVIASNYFKKKDLSVALISPCFDNLPDIMKHMQIPLEPLLEEWMHNPDELYDNLKNNVKSDVLFIVSPNNPTGWELTGGVGTDFKKGFEELIRYAKDHNKILSFDFCFASAILHDENTPTFDVYGLLEESGVSYVAYEDTGKTWPLQDAKAAILKCSKDIYPELYDIHTAYLLNVSPFILNVITEYINDSIKDGGDSIIGLLERNKEITKNYLDGEYFEMHEPKIPISVAWLKIKNPNIKATDLQKKIYEKAKVYVLPGTYFFWDNPEKGERYIRLALARDTEILEGAVKAIAEIIPDLK